MVRLARGRDRVRSVVVLIVALTLVAVAAAGPAAAVADAAPKKCRAGYKLQKKRGQLRCVKRPKEPEPKKDAVYPSSIELIVAKLERGRFGATGFMRFSGQVTGTAYGHWVFSNGIATVRHPFSLRVTRTDYTPFTIGWPIETHINGRVVTATLVIGRTRSNTMTL